MAPWKTTVTIAFSVLFAAAPVQAQQVIAFQNATVETATDQGTIEGATILVRDGRVSEIGTDVSIPVTAQVVDLSGKTMLARICRSVLRRQNIAGSTGEASVSRSRPSAGVLSVFPPVPRSVPTSFTRILDGFDPTSEDWWEATRSGITSAQLVARGVGESAIATVLPETPEAGIAPKESRPTIPGVDQSVH